MMGRWNEDIIMLFSIQAWKTKTKDREAGGNA
jgi:hypothetical protein